MSLPQVITPEFDLTLPLSKTKIRYRPFLTKESKLFLMLGEQSTNKETLAVVKQVLANCIIKPKNLELEALPVAEIEYLFVRLRSKSIGEKIELQFKCHNQVNKDTGPGECGFISQIELDLEKEVQLISDPKLADIKINATAGLRMKHPSLSLSDKIDDVDLQDGASVFDVLIQLIDFVYDGDEITKAADVDPEEFSAWIDTLPQSVFNAIKEFVAQAPKVAAEIAFECPKCGHAEKVFLEGIDDFFG